MCEVWVPIQGYEGLYEISNMGRVRSLDKIIIQRNGTKIPRTGRILHTSLSAHGYYRVILTKGSVSHSYSVHRLVGMHFISNPENKPHINHIDGNKLNNCIENLEWCTAKENTEHAWRTGLITAEMLSEAALRRDIYCVELKKYYRSRVEAAKDLSVSKRSVELALKQNRPIRSSDNNMYYTLMCAKDVRVYMELVRRFNQLLCKPIIVFENELGVYAQL